MAEPISISELERVAGEATPGPWVFGSFHRVLVVPVDEDGHPRKHDHIADLGEPVAPWNKTLNSRAMYNDAEHIAAMHHETAKKLLAVVRAAVAVVIDKSVPMDSTTALRTALQEFKE